MKAWFEARFLEDSGQIRTQVRWEDLRGEWLDVGLLLPNRETAARIYALLILVMQERYRHDPTTRPYRFNLIREAQEWPGKIRVLVHEETAMKIVVGLGGMQTLGEERFGGADEAEAARTVMASILEVITGFARAATRPFKTPHLGSGRGSTLSVPPPAPVTLILHDDPGIELELALDK